MTEKDTADAAEAEAAAGEAEQALPMAVRRLNNLLYQAARGGAGQIALDIIYVQGPGISHPIPQISVKTGDS